MWKPGRRIDSFYKDSVQAPAQSSKHFNPIPWACYRYLGTRGNTASLSVYLKKRKDKRKHHIPTCPLKGKFSISPTLGLLGLFLSLWKASSTHDGLSSPLPYLTMDGDLPKLHVVSLHLFCLLIWSPCALWFAGDRSRVTQVNIC